jgi:DNA repair protein RadC
MSEEEQVVQNKKAMNEQLKKDLQKEHQELGKILMTKKQRRILYDHEKNKKQHKDSVKKLVEKKMKIQQRK